MRRKKGMACMSCANKEAASVNLSALHVLESLSGVTFCSELINELCSSYSIHAPGNKYPVCLITALIDFPIILTSFTQKSLSLLNFMLLTTCIIQC